ncbi:hypothetical protein [Paenibacillus polymyxa]|uniref:Uncharacterized protein n=1 Tax=Paenibacillus polymyxa (strain SC2) TaxID=886882 RepID=E3E9U8_PAEPS|nr:hypothetical protein [Paenibacillus polymyxa]ADO57888.1 hypothetical protein PPSC2_18385 [Paenibacillus polymyxa SC2]OAZ49923.1 hypothetical protein A9Z39_08165 [Paenibacillus polymyxa]WPQ55610.1 hypothetical protein SKN87_18710 [Paenibacillus polymyxa]CCI70508.1 hypothetical protein PPM_3699 [Paenibacillus polymyxa M1]
MIKYKYKLKYMEKFNIVVLDFDEEKSLEFANMISDPLGSDIPWRFKDLKIDIDNYIDLLRGNIPQYNHGGNASSVISYRDYTIIEDPFYDEEEDEVEPICKLETVEFVKIILVWAYETYKYKSERGVIAQEEAEMVMNWIKQKMTEVKSIENNE